MLTVWMVDGLKVNGSRSTKGRDPRPRQWQRTSTKSSRNCTPSMTWALRCPSTTSGTGYSFLALSGASPQDRLAIDDDASGAVQDAEHASAPPPISAAKP